MPSPTTTSPPNGRLDAVERRCTQIDHLVDTIASRPPADPDVSAQAAMILRHEARQLDARRFDDWLDGWTPDGLWWVPISHVTPNARAQSLALDDVRRLRERIEWMNDSAAWSQQPATRVIRSVSAVEAWIDDRLVTSSVLTISSVRRGNVQMVAARQIHEFAVDVDGDHEPLTEDRLRLRSKVILLVDSELGQSNPGYLL